LFVLFLIVYSVPDETRRLLCPQCSSAQLSSGPPAKRSRGGMQTDEDQAWKAPFQSADQRFHSAAQTYLKLILSSSGEISYSIYFCTYFSHICANVCSRAVPQRGANLSETYLIKFRRNQLFYIFLYILQPYMCKCMLPRRRRSRSSSFRRAGGHGREIRL
jgi:hypothetical protein